MQHRQMQPRSLLLAALFSLLSGCGGGTSSTENPPTAEPVELATAPNNYIKRLAVTGGTAAEAPPPVVVDSMTLTEEKRVGRTIFEYTFRVKIINNGTAIQSGTATLTAVGAGASVVDGTVSIGALGAGANITPADSITIRQDRLVQFNPNAFAWRIVAINVPPLEDVPGIDANNNGVRDDVETYIAGAYPASPQRDAMMQVAAGLQLTATAATAADRLAAETARVAAGLCLADRSSPAQAGQLIAVIQGKQFNTPERARAEFAFRDSLAGKTVSSSPNIAIGSTCK
jgi:hypothetical protein